MLRNLESLEWTSASVRGRYYGYQAAETVIWSRWLDRHASEVVRVCYGVLLGQGVSVPSGVPEWLARDWQDLTRLRLDALVDMENGLLLCEVKVRQSMSGLGQLLAYRDLAVTEFGLGSALGLKLVCERAVPDLDGAYRTAGVGVEVV